MLKIAILSVAVVGKDAEFEDLLTTFASTTEEKTERLAVDWLTYVLKNWLEQYTLIDSGFEEKMNLLELCTSIKDVESVLEIFDKALEDEEEYNPVRILTDSRVLQS